MSVAVDIVRVTVAAVPRIVTVVVVVEVLLLHVHEIGPHTGRHRLLLLLLGIGRCIWRRIAQGLATSRSAAVNSRFVVVVRSIRVGGARCLWRYGHRHVPMVDVRL